MADEPAHGAAHGKGKMHLPPALEKHKGLVAAGLLGLLLLIYFMSRSNSSGAGTAQSAAAIPDPNASSSPLTDPALAGMLSGMGAIPGPAGSTGPTGATGPAGPQGRFSIWQEAKARLIAKGNKNPSQGQIDRERRRILGQKQKGTHKVTDGPNPPKKAAVQAMPAAHVTPAAHGSKPPARAGRKN